MFAAAATRSQAGETTVYKVLLFNHETPIVSGETHPEQKLAQKDNEIPVTDIKTKINMLANTRGDRLNASVAVWQILLVQQVNKPH